MCYVIKSIPLTVFYLISMRFSVKEINFNVFSMSSTCVQTGVGGITKTDLHDAV